MTREVFFACRKNPVRRIRFDIKILPLGSATLAKFEQLPVKLAD